MAVKVLVRDKGAGRNLLLYYVDPATSLEVSRSSGTRDGKEALKAAARWEDELIAYRGRDDDGWRLFRDRFRDEHLVTLSSKSYDSFTTALNHLDRLILPASVAEVTAGVLSLFQAKLLGEKRKLTSIGTYLRHIRTALNWAESVGILAKAPKVKIPRQPTRVFMRGRPITEAEYGAMLEACGSVCGADAPAWRRLLELLWLSGLRLSEALKLSWDRPPVYLTLEMAPYPQLLFFAEGQKSRQDEAVPMPPDLAAWLEQTPQVARKGLVAPVPLESQPRVSDQITAIGKTAGVVVNDDGKPASAHDLRRSFGSRWARKLMPMDLMRLMRHKDISTTLKFYIGMTSSDLGRTLWGDVAPEPVPKTVPKTSRKGRKAG